MVHGPHDSRTGARDDGHTIPGELVGTGTVAPGGRSYDPLAGPGTAPPHRPAEVQLRTAPHGPWHAAAPASLPPPPRKSVGLAFLLTFLFGPLGMLYSTVTGALVMLGITAVVSVIAGVIVGLISLATFGLGALLVVLAPLVGLPIWIASMIWSCLAAAGHNDRVQLQYAQHGAAHAQYGAQQASAQQASAQGFGPAGF